MSNRVLAGNRGGVYGLWVSKSGFDVLTTATENLLFDSTSSTVRVLAKGSVYFAANGSNVQNISYGMTGPAGSGPVFRVLRLGSLSDGMNQALLFDYSVTSTGATITRSTLIDDAECTIYWQLTTEVGGI